MKHSKGLDNAYQGWHSRNYLPHFDGGEIIQNVTFRLDDSFPAHKLDEWADDLKNLSKCNQQEAKLRLVEEYLDKGTGDAWLSVPEIAETVETALLYFDTVRYNLHAWVVMPNHVHVLFSPMANNSLSQIMHTWKSYTAKKANKLLGRSGQFWQKEYFDRAIRNEDHFSAAIEYIEKNPVNAGLCAHPNEWNFTSAAYDRVQAAVWTPPSYWHEF